jgi:hypothetical protein
MTADQDTISAPTAYLAFSAADLAFLEALRPARDAAGWQFHLDQDEDHDLIAAVRPGAREGAASYVIVPATEGVLMSCKDDAWSTEIAFPTLGDALLATN